MSLGKPSLKVYWSILFCKPNIVIASQRVPMPKMGQSGSLEAQSPQLIQRRGVVLTLTKKR